MAGWSAVQQGSSLEGGLFNIPSLCGKAKCLAAVVWKLVLRFTSCCLGQGLTEISRLDVQLPQLFAESD
jgi:hypothetical protein